MRRDVANFAATVTGNVGVTQPHVVSGRDQDFLWFSCLFREVFDFFLKLSDGFS